MREIRPSGSMSGTWKRSDIRHRATSRLYPPASLEIAEDAEKFSLSVLSPRRSLRSLAKRAVNLRFPARHCASGSEEMPAFAFHFGCGYATLCNPWFYFLRALGEFRAESPHLVSPPAQQPHPRCALRSPPML